MEIASSPEVTVSAGTKTSRDASSVTWHPQDWMALLFQGLLIPPVQMRFGIFFFILLSSFFFPMNCRCSLQKSKASGALSSYPSLIGFYPNGELIATLRL